MNLTERAYDVIKHRILRLEIPPGAFFTESQLAQELATSKTPVREALGLLRREGLVEVSPRCGYFASPVTLTTARDLFDVRFLLEVEAVGLAATQREDLSYLVSLDKLSHASYDPTDPDSISTFLRANTELHATIARASGNYLLAQLVRQVLDRMERLFHLGLSLSSRSEEIVHEHQDLLNAILKGDVERAKQTTREQILASQNMVMAALLSSAAILTTNLSSPSTVG